MGNFVGSGGFMLLALALIWFFLFVPAWTKRSEQKGEAARERETKREKLNRSVTSGVALKAAKLARAKNISLSLSISAVLVATLSLTQGALVVAAIAAVPAVAFGAISLTFSRKLTAHLLEGARVRNKVASGLIGRRTVTQEPAQPVIEKLNGWTPGEVPEQVFGRAGILEEVTLADVVELPIAAKLESKDLDEILRRRRAN